MDDQHTHHPMSHLDGITSSVRISLQKRNCEGFIAWLVEPDYMQESNPDGPALLPVLLEDSKLM
jgi:hypothetical protein